MLESDCNQPVSEEGKEERYREHLGSAQRGGYVPATDGTRVCSFP